MFSVCSVCILCVVCVVCSVCSVCVSCVYPVGVEEGVELQGELLLQDSFQVWEPKSLIRKGRDRHLFLFELSLIFSKEIKDSSGRTKYLYKSRLRVLIHSTTHSTQY